MEETGDDMQSTGKECDNRERTSCDVGSSRSTDKSESVETDDTVIRKEKDDDCKLNKSDENKESSAFRKSKNFAKRKYHLRSSKGDASEDEDSIMQTDVATDTSNVTNTGDNVKPVMTRSKSAKISKKRKKSVSKKSSAGSKNESPSQSKKEFWETSWLATDNSNSKASMKNADDSSSDSESSRLTLSSISSCSSSSSGNRSSMNSSKCECEEDKKEELTDDEDWLSKHINPLGPPTWIAVKEIYNRQIGCRNLYWQHKVRGSQGLVSRLDQQYTLDAHQGCVNALHFNQTGSLLASGSDDLDINIWDFQSSDRKPFISYNSGHRSNVFQSKFMPNSNDLTVVSCARDGQVRVGCLSSTGTCRDTKKLAQHRGSAHKLSLDRAGSNSIFFSCGEDGVVMEFDMRENNPSRKLVTVKEGSSKIALYAIDTSPRQPFEFAVSGRDEWARVYDRRMLSSENPETVAKYSPFHLQCTSRNKDPVPRAKTNITCLVYNHDGRELLCSYNDEDIYLFDATRSSMDEFTRKFKGHRNSATVKGVNFYGPNSEFIVSGSDCGNIFLWDKASSQIVRFMEGDDGGVINVLEPHPNLPILATSGLDSNIKIWGPSGDGELDKKKLMKLMLGNRKERYDESNAAGIDSQLLWFLMRTLRSRRHVGGGDDFSDHSSSGPSDSEEEGRRGRVDCLPS